MGILLLFIYLFYNNNKNNKLNMPLTEDGKTKLRTERFIDDQASYRFREWSIMAVPGFD